MNIDKIQVAFICALDALQKIEQIKKILKKAKADVFLEENAEMYLQKIEEILSWTQI